MLTLFDAYATSTDTSGTSLVSSLIGLVIAVVLIAAIWRLFSKAGQPGWAAIIPIFSTIVLLRVAGRPWWWFLLLLIPVVNIVISFIVYNDLSKSFGRGIGTTLGLFFLTPIFLLILGFGGAKYVGPAARFN